jgi:hypothetical protein
MTIQEILKELNKLKTLKDGWGNNGKAISQEVIDKAEEILVRTEKYEPYAYPLTDGGVQVEYQIYADDDEYYLEFEVYKDYIGLYSVIANKEQEVERMAKFGLLDRCVEYVETFFKEIR